MSNTVRNVAASLGTAVLTTYMTTQSKIYATQMSWQVTQTSSSGQFMKHIQQAMQAKGMSIQATKQVAASMMNGLIQQRAFVSGLDDTFWISMILTAIAFVLILFYSSKNEREIREQKRSKMEKQGKGQPTPATE
jgi:Ca2+/Na+ antiporter